MYEDEGTPAVVESVEGDEYYPEMPAHADVHEQTHQALLEAFGLQEQDWDDLPLHDVGQRRSDYIDWITATDLHHPVSRVRDVHGRPGISLRLRMMEFEETLYDQLKHAGNLEEALQVLSEAQTDTQALAGDSPESKDEDVTAAQAAAFELQPLAVDTVFLRYTNRDDILARGGDGYTLPNRSFDTSEYIDYMQHLVEHHWAVSPKRCIVQLV